MCGFVAVSCKGPLDVAILATMRDRIAHRGPDGQGIWVGRAGDQTIGLAHRRLSIIDLSNAGTQPMFAANGQVAIVFNGEIFNFVELRDELRAMGVVFRSQCDTEVLLESYLIWGEDCLSRFNGQFAFVLWDSRKRTVFAARDRFGEKPFYYAPLKRGGTAMASEMKALFAHPDVLAEPDIERLEPWSDGKVDYWSRNTLFKNVFQLEAAHAMILDASGEIQRHWRYWMPNHADVRKIKPRDAIAEFHQRLSNGVRLRLRSDVRVGACLSGGLDSSSLVALMAKQGLAREGQLMQTISARFGNDATLDEGPHIDSVLRATGADGLGITPDPSRMAEESRKLHWHQEFPFLSASAYLEWCVHHAARDSGLTVMIDGQGADELLGGYQFYFAVKQNDWMNTNRWFKLISNTLLHGRYLKREAEKYVDANRRFNTAGAGSVREHIRIARENRGLRKKGRPLIAQPSVTMRPGTPDPANGNFFRFYLANGFLYSTLPNQLVMSDRNAMAFGVEARFPFLDYELVDWCTHLPDDVLIRNGWQKWILRKSVEGLLPEDVQWRGDKVGFAAPQDQWLRGPIREWAYDLLFEGPVTELPFYDREKLRGLWDRHLAGEELSWPLWRWISINEWLRLARDGVWKDGLTPSVSHRSEEIFAEPRGVGQA